MQIRAATEADIPAIVELLKLSLGESLMPKSEAFWRWKHVNNPFGSSPVLVAEEHNELVGVRAFMCWHWQIGDQMIKAVRAVDTATHPKHQGKGIFKQLTLQLVDQCQADGVHFIFNTPNKSSKPGYIKMGWSSLGRMKIFMKPMFGVQKKIPGFDVQYRFMELTAQEVAVNNAMLYRTPVTSAFLNWRFANNPNASYMGFKGQDYFTIFRLKPYRLGTEFRICYSARHGANSKWYEHLREVVRQSGANLVTDAESLPGFSTALRLGPEVTIRPLKAGAESISFETWAPTLGDMELF
jgi:N-acetylglutamate synthase-like GNAT family acetyltransferase